MENQLLGIRGYLIDAPEFGALRGRRNGGLVIENGRIAAIGDYDDLRRLRQSIHWIDHGNVAVFPGLIDVHTHLPQYPAVCLLGLNGTFARLSAMSASGRK